MRAGKVACLVLLLAAGAAGANEEAALAKGRAAARALNDTLRARLMAALKSSGPEGALAVCSYQAQALASEVERNHDVRVKRTSLKVRNPKNAPDPYEKGLLAKFGTEVQEGRIPGETLEVVRQGGEKVYRYAQPIMMVPGCISCHGVDSEVPAEIRRTLSIRYPDDNAMGYKLGDLRGIVSVTIPVQ